MRNLLHLIIGAVVTISILVTTVSCFRKQLYPIVLTKADSALIHGNYLKADTLLNRYDKVNNNDYLSSHLAYRQLLSLERRFVVSELREDDFSLADSLVRYYEGGKNSRGNYIKSLLFLADIYQQSGDYPTALHYLMNAETEATALSDTLLCIWSNRMLGNIYFDQRMLTECITYYRRLYELATLCHDTIRMSIGAHAMARACMINNDADSAFYYLNQSIEWGEKLSNAPDIVATAKSLLSDLYIQTEQFEKAEANMTRDSINDYNWAYWHLGQCHIDSAMFYFQKLLERNGWNAKAENLQMLVTLAEKKGDSDLSLKYYRELEAAIDSAKACSQVQETYKTQTQYKYNSIRMERDKAAKHSKRMTVIATVLLCILLLLTLIFLRLRKKYRQHMQQTAMLPQLTDDYDKKQRQQIKQLYTSELYLRIKQHAGNPDFHLSDNDWQQLMADIDATYNSFSSRLLSVASLSEHELQICCLIKLGISSSNIGLMLYRSKAAIGMTRQRLYKKLTGTTGTAKELNNYIERF